MRALVITRQVVLWSIAAFLVYVFLRQGIAKFSDDSGWARAFRVWHYPDWFRVLVGVTEVVAAMLLLVPRTALAGGLLIILVMLGAMGTHIFSGHPAQVTSEVVPLILATIVVLGRRRSFFRFGNRRHSA